MHLIHHIARRGEWDEACEAGEYVWSTRDRSLQEVGFVHCSNEHQVLTVANAFYLDEDQPLVLLTIDTDLLDVEVVHENVEGGGEIFPHVYGPIPVTAVVRVDVFERDGTGHFVLPHEDG
jgi:uncharacterized protein (DUF952 family)